MMDIVFYANGTAKNHGCEALIRSLAKIFAVDRNAKLTLASMNKSIDCQYGLDDIVNISTLVNSDEMSFLRTLNYRLRQHLKYSDLRYYKVIYKKFIKEIDSRKSYISIGGDNYSYGKSDWLSFLNSNIHRKKAKTILLGCSILEQIDDCELIRDLHLYNGIIARESITLDALKKAGITDNVYLAPDPAFCLGVKYLPLPCAFKDGNTVGINISPVIMNHDIGGDVAFRNYDYLIDDILRETDMSVALIPHVVAEHGNDDRIPLLKLYKKYNSSGRVALIENCNAEELKGFISRCRFMVAARTHASIAAYSMGVPRALAPHTLLKHPEKA